MTDQSITLKREKIILQYSSIFYIGIFLTIFLFGFIEGITDNPYSTGDFFYYVGFISTILALVVSTYGYKVSKK